MSNLDYIKRSFLMYTKPYVIPSVYSVEEIRAIEETIDTGTIIGKRDYAMILLASRMGMRSGDIARLRMRMFRIELT